ncbi:MAG TPA: hypothetical protein VJ770_27525 [Stellaceae bacterium]|nr:hypothetical protein [Stellaceae bacterium]
MRWSGPAAVVGICLLSAVVPPAAAASPAALCRKVGTDDRLRPIPQALVPAAVRLFHLNAMPAAQIRRSTYFRCFEGQVLVCTLGANLPCGMADASRYLAGADRWCAGHPGADFIPRYVTGHDTIYRWRCTGKKAAVTGQPLTVDRRGFIARFWKRADSD